LTGDEVKEEGLRNVHNDACYPALLVVGQFVAALQSGKYDVHHTALMISQTGGGCRASNYIFLIRKALAPLYPDVPVLSFNFSGLEKGNAMKFTPVELLKTRSRRLLWRFPDGPYRSSETLRKNPWGQCDALLAKRGWP
jgi:predicted nucleotide-binding protein (sugar kinase/HSP70/actin superfamily)